jgi:hypothetical protein
MLDAREMSRDDFRRLDRQLRQLPYYVGGHGMGARRRRDFRTATQIRSARRGTALDRSPVREEQPRRPMDRDDKDQFTSRHALEVMTVWQERHHPRGDEETVYRAHQTRLMGLIAHDVSARPQVIEDACAFAWAELLARQPERTSIVGWLRVIARREAIRLARLTE